MAATACEACQAVTPPVLAGLLGLFRELCRLSAGYWYVRQGYLSKQARRQEQRCCSGG